jgi:hypothetical protein
MTLNMEYFETLRGKINNRLIELVKEGKYDTALAKSQVEDFPWLYGALGQVPSDVMFICENPSIAGIKKAHIDTIDGGPPDIEAQWWGGSTDFAATRFRVALFQLGLKATGPRERGGWNCYITNVIKQSEKAIIHEKTDNEIKRQMARDWADILHWEIDHVKPKYVFCVGGAAHTYVRLLQRERLLKNFPLYEVCHYSGRDTTEKIVASIISTVQEITGSKIQRKDFQNDFQYPMGKSKPIKEPVELNRINLKGVKMTGWYSELKKLDGHKCFTLTQDKPAITHIDEDGVTIEYPTHGKTRIPRSMLEEANHKLYVKGVLTLEDVHEVITDMNGPRTDRLMAIFRELPGIGFSRAPRTLFLKK